MVRTTNDDWWILGYRRHGNHFELWAEGPVRPADLANAVASVLDHGTAALLCRGTPRVMERVRLVQQGIPLLKQGGIERLYL